MKKRNELIGEIEVIIESINRERTSKGLQLRDIAKYLTEVLRIPGFTATNLSNLRNMEFVKKKSEDELEFHINKLKTIEKAIKELGENKALKSKVRVKRDQASKISLFHNTKWKLYYKTNKNSDFFEDKKLAIGVMKIVDEVEPVLLTSVGKIVEKKPTEYFGKINILPSNAFIELVLNTKYGDKYLNILGYIGTGELPELFIGLYHNITGQQDLALGIILFQQVDLEEDVEVKILNGGIDGMEEEIIEFFNKIHTNSVFIIPSSISSFVTLKRYNKGNS